VRGNPLQGGDWHFQDRGAHSATSHRKAADATSPSGIDRSALTDVK
jgi:hypothetical protein